MIGNLGCRAAHDTDSSTYYPAYSSWLNFGESYVSTILENLQVGAGEDKVPYRLIFFPTLCL